MQVSRSENIENNRKWWKNSCLQLLSIVSYCFPATIFLHRTYVRYFFPGNYRVSMTNRFDMTLDCSKFFCCFTDNFPCRFNVVQISIGLCNAHSKNKQIVQNSMCEKYFSFLINGVHQYFIEFIAIFVVKTNQVKRRLIQ